MAFHKLTSLTSTALNKVSSLTSTTVHKVKSWPFIAVHKITSWTFSESHNWYIGLFSGATVAAMTGIWATHLINYRDPGYALRHYRAYCFGTSMGLISAIALTQTQYFNNPPLVGSLITTGFGLTSLHCCLRAIWRDTNSIEPINYIGIGVLLSAAWIQLETHVPICSLPKVVLLMSASIYPYRVYHDNGFGCIDYIGIGVIISACWNWLTEVTAFVTSVESK